MNTPFNSNDLFSGMDINKMQSELPANIWFESNKQQNPFLMDAKDEPEFMQYVPDVDRPEPPLSIYELRDRGMIGGDNTPTPEGEEPKPETFLAPAW